MELKWISNRANKNKGADRSSDDCCGDQERTTRFSFKTDLLRGLLEGFISFIGYLLMLVVGFLLHFIGMISMFHDSILGLGHGDERLVFHCRSLCSCH
jgi:hypothetical protein